MNGDVASLLFAMCGTSQCEQQHVRLRRVPHACSALGAQTCFSVVDQPRMGRVLRTAMRPRRAWLNERHSVAARTEEAALAAGSRAYGRATA